MHRIQMLQGRLAVQACKKSNTIYVLLPSSVGQGGEGMGGLGEDDRVQHGPQGLRDVSCQNRIHLLLQVPLGVLFGTAK